MLWLAATAAFLKVISTDPEVIALDDRAQEIMADIGGGLDVELMYMPCGYPNAFYMDSIKAVVVCEEMSWTEPGYQKFVIAHELGHAVIAQYDLPITGSEEVAADEFAALTLIATDRSDDLLDTVAHYWADSTPEDPTDEHSSAARRAYALVCLYSGSSDRPVGDCQSTFQHALRNWTRLLHTRNDREAGE